LGKASRKRKSHRQIDAPAAGNAGSGAASGGFPWWLVAVLCLVAFAAFAKTISYEFVYDDDTQILRNPWIREWTQVWRFFAKDVGAFAGESPLNYFRPFHMLAHAISFAVSGLNPVGFHLVNVLLHCINTVLVALFGYRLTRDRTASAAGGFLFAVHPVHVESVSWISGIPDPLCAVFYIGALYVYANRDPSKERKASLVGALLFLGALFSKEMAFMVPLMAVWLDLCLGRKLRWGRYAAMAVAFGFYAALRIHALSSFQVKMLSLPLSLPERLLSSVVLWGEYCAKAFVPFNINAFHVFYPTLSAADFRFASHFLVLAALGLGAWFLRKDRNLLFLTGFIPLSLIPVLNITGIAQNVFADRYLYIPTLGSCLLLPLLVQKAARSRLLRSMVTEKKIVLGFCGAAGVVFAFQLNNAAAVWRDNLTLYSETLKQSPDSAPMANCLSDWYFKKGLMKEAEYWGLRAVENWSSSYIKLPQLLSDIYIRLAFVCLDGRRVPEAMEYLNRAEQISPDSPGILQGRAKAYMLQGKFAEARKACEASIALNPQNDMMHNNLAIILLIDGEYDRAIREARKAIEIFPHYAEAYMNLARGYAAKGLTAEAVKSYRMAQQLNPELKAEVDRELSLIK
jgi:tetratricopeptide (TPR) repeat protein